ncbi:hypothetical protein [Dactylosporangium sp. NPDC048998]|uniref:hypothetical protein n=1 Tax=Dactylosporangium sp. NPDC048998 TaxID=3363976 RepID=UPI003722A5DB
MGKSGVTAVLTVAALIALVYAALICAHAAAIRRRRLRGAYEPRAARWLAARFGPLPEPGAAEDRLARAERRTTDRLLRGELDPAEYRAAMAEVAALEAEERPLRTFRR